MTAAASGTFSTASGPQNGATVDLWLSSRTWAGGQPVGYNASPPSGSPDYGPVTTGTTYGAPGAWEIASVADGTYYVRAQYGGNTYWRGPVDITSDADVVHITGTEDVTGNKTFSGTVGLGKGTAVTTRSSGGSTRNTLDDGTTGNITAAGYVRTNSTDPTTPDLWLGAADVGSSSLGTNYGVNRDHNSGIEINAAATGGIYTRIAGTQKNTLDDGTGAMTVANGLTVITGGLTVSAGSISVPNASIDPAAINGLGSGFTGAQLSASQTFTGQQTFDNDVLVKGGQVTATALATPSAPVITHAGTSGGATYQYQIVATTYDGRDTIPSATGQTTSGNATLTGSNYNIITWSTSNNAASYRILKFVSGVWKSLTAGVTGTTYNDTGAATPITYAALTINPGGEVAGTTITGSSTVTGTNLVPTGLTGATSAVRIVGGTASVAPTSGTFAVGDLVVGRAGFMWVCITAGTPGTWVGFAPAPTAAMVAAGETTASATYVDLATVGPAVTVNTLTTAWVEVGAAARSNVASYSLMSFAVSGATTIAAADAHAAEWNNATINTAWALTFGSLVTGLTPGANTFTAKYEAGGGGTSTFIFRNIKVTPLSV